MKLKTKTVYRCQECGHTTIKWLGRCPDCGKWNTFVEEHTVALRKNQTSRRLTDFSSEVSLLTSLGHESLTRYPTGISEFDRLTGGGVVDGSLVLLGGQPGIGKSTLMLQVAALLSKELPVLYVSGEESLQQIKSRADRLHLNNASVYLASETDLEKIMSAVHKVNPKILIIDSIQTVYRQDIPSSPGSVGQVRECAAEFLHCAKSKGITIFLLGHVTKEGDIAGPRVLEHIVDTVLYFDEERQHNFRILHVFKNRFGPTQEIGLFEMGSTGLKEMTHANDIFISERTHGSPGCVIVAPREGSRTLFLEIQALLSRTHFGYPKRQVNGIEYNRALMLIAVLEKKLGLQVETEDIFINVVGGMRIKEPSVDLGVCAAVASAFKEYVVNPHLVLLGEVGLAGEIRSVPVVSTRLKEAAQLGFTHSIVPKNSLKEIESDCPLKVTGVSHIKEAMEVLGVIL